MVLSKLRDAWPWLASIGSGVILGLCAYLGTNHAIQPENVSPPAIEQTVPMWLGFNNAALFDRYPLYYCLLDTPGGKWTHKDHLTAQDAIQNPWAWSKVDRTIAVQIEERCDELLRNTVVFQFDNFVRNVCQPDAGFSVVACVSFDGWEYRSKAKVWTHSKAIVHVDYYKWLQASNSWRSLIFTHEFGHAGMSLNDTPSQAPGVTAMDYTYEVIYGLLAYPSAADIDMVNRLYGSYSTGYKDPAWYRCTITGSCIVDP